MSPWSLTNVSLFGDGPQHQTSEHTDQLLAEFRSLRLDDPVLLQRVALLVHVVVSRPLLLQPALHAIQMQATRQLVGRNLRRWRRLRDVMTERLQSQFDLALLLTESTGPWDKCRPDDDALATLTRLVAGLYVQGLLEASIVHYCFNRLISRWVDPNTWQPVHDQHRTDDDGAMQLETALELLTSVGPLLAKDVRGGDEQRRLRARVRHYFDVVFDRLRLQLCMRRQPRLYTIVERFASAVPQSVFCRRV